MEDIATPTDIDPRDWMSLDEACSRLDVTPRRLGELVHQGLVSRRHTGRAARYRVSHDQLLQPDVGSEESGYVAALVNRLFEMEEDNSNLTRRLRAVEMQVEFLLDERTQLVRERDEAVSRWKEARKELRLLIGNARGVIAETRSRVSAALVQVASQSRAA